MSAITDEVERLVPSSDSRPLMRGLLVGALVGATVAGVAILVLTIQSRRAAGRRQRPTPPPAAPLGAEPSPL